MQGAIFDMDGTLLDSMPFWGDSADRFLMKRGVRPPPGLYEALKDLSMVQTADYLRERFGVTGTVQDVMDGINEVMEESYFHQIPPKADILSFVDRLARAGVRMCVATATDRYLAEAVLKRVGLLGRFEFLLTCTEVGAGKHLPVIYERACERLGLPREEVVVFEDALYAVETAKAAGFPVVAIADRSAAGDEPRIRALADRFVKQYAELNEWE